MQHASPLDFENRDGEFRPFGFPLKVFRYGGLVTQRVQEFDFRVLDVDEDDSHAMVRLSDRRSDASTENVPVAQSGFVQVR